MLNMLEARTNQGTLLSLPLGDISDGFILTDVKGLDPVKATLVSSSFAERDGAQYHSSRREPRNIKLQIEFEPNYISSSVRSLRQRLYVFFMPKSEVNLRFYDSSGLTVNISGRVESFETPLFTKDPVVDISIICFDPDFIDMDSIDLSGNTTSTTTETTIVYDGTTETGIQFVLNLNRSLSEFTIYHKPPDGTIRSLDFSASLISGDVLTISTVSGSKGVKLTRSGVSSSLLYGISPQSNWIEFMRGDNKIRVYAVGAPIPFTLTYINRYGGL